MTEKVEHEEKTEFRETLHETARKLLLAKIGAMAIVQDKIESCASKMMERNGISEEDARKMIDDVREHRRERVKKIAAHFDKRMEAFFTRMNVPTKADVEALSEKVAALTEKIDELKISPAK